MSETVYSPKFQEYYQSGRGEMLDLVPLSAQRILELGCGSGAFGRALKARGAEEVVGIELQAGPAAEAGQVLDKVIIANVDLAFPELPTAYFDCIVCNDVLEHLVDPWTVLSKLTVSLKPGGVVVASIPNVRHHKVVRRLFWSGHWRYEDAGILDRTHLRFFTRQTAIELLSGAGLKVEHVAGLNRSSLPGWMRLLNFGDRFTDMQFIQFGLVGRKP